MYITEDVELIQSSKDHKEYVCEQQDNAVPAKTIKNWYIVKSQILHWYVGIGYANENARLK